MEKVIKTFGDFLLVYEEFENIYKEKCQALNVKSTGTAEKHVIEIRLNGRKYPLNGGEVNKYLYYDCYISHGLRGVSDTLAETKEYIDTLTAALDAAFSIKAYCFLNGWWKE